MRLRTRPNHALQPTPGSGGSSAARVTSLGPAWLSLFLVRPLPMSAQRKEKNGEPAFAAFQRAFGVHYNYAGLGSVIELP